MDGLGHHKAQAAQNLGTDRYSDQRHAAIGIVALARGQHRRHDHRAGMHGTAFKGVVEIFTVGGRAIDESRARGGQHATMADRGADTIVIAAAQRTCDIALVARGNA